ncbi:hypothetical protein FHD45_04760 [Escherichia coli]|nr:hypothetical protein [Escherichia coli]
MLAMPGASFRREATKGLPEGSLLQAGDCAIISGAGRKNCFLGLKVCSIVRPKNEGAVAAPSISQHKNHQVRMVSSLASTSLITLSGMRSSRLPFLAPISIVLG